MILPLDGVIDFYGGNLNQALGTDETDLGRLCSDGFNGSAYENDGRINKWAKRKPVRRNSDIELTEAERKWDSESFPSDFYGLTLPTEYSNPLDACQDENAYAYNRPRGVFTTGEQSRALDFRGYQTDATPPISALSNLEINKGETSSWGFNFVYRATGTDYQFGMKEMPTPHVESTIRKYLQDCFLAMVIVRNGTAYYKTTQYKIGGTDAGNEIVFTTSDLPSFTGDEITCDYYVIACLQEKSVRGDYTDGGQRFFKIPFPNFASSKGTIKIKNTIPASVVVTLLKIAHSVYAGDTWSSKENISTYAPQHGTPDQYFNITDASDNVHFGFSVRNTGSGSFTINCNNSKVNLTPSCNGSDPCGGRDGENVSQVLYTTSTGGSLVEAGWSLTIPAGATYYVFFRSPGNFGKHINGAYQSPILNFTIKGALITLAVGDTRISPMQSYVNIKYGNG